jgi:alpha-glucosidase
MKTKITRLYFPFDNYSKLLIIIALVGFEFASAASIVLKSPDKTIQLSIAVDNKQLSYIVAKNNIEIIAPSTIGIMVDSIALGSDVTLTGKAVFSKINEKYSAVGNHPNVVNKANEVAIPLQSSGKFFKVFVRVYNDGFGIRYGLPEGSKRLNADLTTWNFANTSGKVAWSDNSVNYESLSRVTTWDKLPESKIIIPPLTIKTNGCWVSVSEADCETFSDMNLQRNRNGLKVVFSYAKKGWDIKPLDGNGPKVLNGTYRGMNVSPWRTTVITTNMTDLINSDLLMNLCPAPAKGSDFSWVKTGRCLWQWWSVGAPKYEDQKQWFDAAAKLKWEYYLIDDGWRVWKQEGKDQWQLLAEVIAYGKSVGVKSIVWVDSKEMRHAKERRIYLEKIKTLGADGIKIDFIPNATAEIMQWYMGSMQDCAELKLMLNFHGSVKPTGLTRTYPNDITREAVRGNEWHMTRYKRVQPLYHDVSIPFTRYLAGAADYTPVMLDPVELSSAKYTWAHQFAQAVVYLSPITHFADQYKFYIESPMFDLFQQVPTIWDETRVLPCTEMGEVVAYARRSGKTWWVGIMNGANEREVKINLNFLKTKTNATLVFDTMKGFAEINRMEKQVNKGETITLKLSPGGGFVGKF